MDRLDAITLFVAAVDTGSLAAAGRHHGRSPASVTRAVALLEDLAREPLLLRSTRRLSLTAAGERHLAVWRKVLLALAELEPDQSGMHLRGTVRVTAPELFGRRHVLPLVERFLDAHPDVSTRLILANNILNLIGEGVDVAVRLAELPDSSLTAIRVGQVQTLLCASPSFVRSSGSPRAPDDLPSYDCIGLNVEAEAELWAFRLPGRLGQPRSIRVTPRLRVDSAAALVDSALRGKGIISAQSYQVADHLAAGRLIRILSQFEGAPTPVHVVFSEEVGASGAARAFIDHLTNGLKPALRSLAAALPPPASS